MLSVVGQSDMIQNHRMVAVSEFSEDANWEEQISEDREDGRHPTYAEKTGVLYPVLQDSSCLLHAACVRKRYPWRLLKGGQEDDLKNTSQYGSLVSEEILRTFSSMDHIK